ncbi:hypothetical protein LTR53_011740 [Teratosphaeriaceae sp. CCFEE 6253]|nr:hypothetical protein LTR53_011740 [Teratosphaeriaceae sp. CCFEE 6253]
MSDDNMGDDNMGDDEPKRTANLARIRDNQRRSRARRKEYLSELEVKYRSCEQIGAEASAEIQAAARRVLDENKRLRELLKQQGLSESVIDGFLSDRPQNPQYPSASTLALEDMIGQRRVCRPGSECDSSSSAGTWQQGPAPSQTAPIVQARPPPRITNAPFGEASPLSSCSSSKNTPGSMHLAALPPQPSPYGTDSLPDLSSMDHGLMYDDAFAWSLPVSNDSSSCYVAAEVIRNMKPDAGYELEDELGCGDGKECHVPNARIFSIMDRYTSGHAG